MLCGSLRYRVRVWLCDYVRLQSHVVILIYAQIGCALIGSLGALYNGVLLINLAIALFALLAIENNSQNLCRTYSFLLFFAILLDISWLLLFSKEIWNMSSEMYQALYIFSVKLTMVMEVSGFVVRLLSSLLWIQIYRLGASTVHTTIPRLPESDIQNSFLEPPNFARNCSCRPDLQNSFLETPAISNEPSSYEEILEESNDESAYYPPPFCDGQNNITSPKAAQVIKHHSTGNFYKGSTSSSAEALQNKSPLSRSLESLDASLC